MTRTLTAIVFGMGLLWSGALPAAAAETNAGGELNFVGIRDKGPTPSWVREYDGRQGDYIEGDLWLKGDYGSVLLDAAVNDINSSDESGSLDLTMGSGLRVKGAVGVMTHRQGTIVAGSVVNNQFKSDQDNGTHSYINMSRDDDLLFKRTEAEAELMVRCPKTPIRSNFVFWQELERGMQPWTGAGAGSREHKVGIDRFTREITGAVEGDAGSATLGYEFSTRKFAERVLPQDRSYTGVNGIFRDSDLRLTGEQAVRKHKFSYAQRLTPNLKVAVGAANRWRQSFLTRYSLSANTGHISAAYKPRKDLSLSARLYGRVTQVDEDDTFQSAGNSTGKEQIDFYQYRGDLKLRYSGIDHVTLNAAYKPMYTYRRHGDQLGESYGEAKYINSVYYAELRNFLNGKDTKQTFQLEAAFDLPDEIELDLSQRTMVADRSAYVGLPALENEQSATLMVPMGKEFSVTASGSHLYARSSHVVPWQNYRRKLVRTLFGVNWFCPRGRGDMAMTYGFEDGATIIDAHFGGGGTGTGASTPINGTMIIIPGAEFAYKNHVAGWNGTVNLPKSARLTADASYTLSKGDFATRGAFDKHFVGGAGTTTQSINPTDIEIIRWGVSGSIPVTEHLEAKASYGQAYWLDAYAGGVTNGRVQAVSVGLSGKF